MLVVTRIVLGLVSASSGVAVSVYRSETFPDELECLEWRTAQRLLLCWSTDSCWHQMRSRALSLHLGMACSIIVSRHLLVACLHVAFHPRAATVVGACRVV